MKKMKANKIIATLVVLTMVLSTLVVLNQLDVVKEASAQPGVTHYGRANMDLIYGQEYAADTIKIDTSGWAPGTYYLYYPNYVSTGAGTATSFDWAGPFEINVQIKVAATGGNDTLDTAGSPITFNRSGMWIFDMDGTHNGGDPTSYGGYIWVNTSTDYSISSVPNFSFGSTTSTTITVDTATDSGCMISIVGPKNTPIYNSYRNTGTVTLGYTNFTYAGDYKVFAYRDLDGSSIYTYQDEGKLYPYNVSYGSSYQGFPDLSGVGDGYVYSNVGPWDPPERNATPITFTVNTGKPNIALTNANLIYGFDTNLTVNVTDANGDPLDDMNVSIKLKYGSYFINMTIFDHIINTNTSDGLFYIDFPRMDVDPTVWQDLVAALEDVSNTTNVNGTWRLYFTWDKNDDTVDEWNNYAIFTVAKEATTIQLRLANYTENEIKWIPAYESGYVAPTVEIQFDIIGKTITGVEAFYGDDYSDPYNETWENIKVEGDILYPVENGSTLQWLSDGRWMVLVTPTKPGGTITISIDWPDNGTASQTLEIVNGIHVVPAVDEFTYGSDFNLTVTIKDMDGAALKYANITLMWENEALWLNGTAGDNTAGNGQNGEYTFWITKDKQQEIGKAPEDITIAAQAYPGASYWGYGKVIMARNHNMMVNITPTTSYAGDATLYDIAVSLVGGGNPAKTGLHIRIYNSTGVEIESGDIDYWFSDDQYTLTDELIPLSGGTFYFYAYNETHDSKGHNATVIVSKYTVTCAPSTLAWLIDTDVNMTFQVTPAENGTLTLDGMSSVPEAWVDDSTLTSIVNGIGTLNGVNAKALGNITFSFYPEGGEDREADGLLRVTTATAIPNPATIYLGEPTIVTITVTHPATGTPLEDVRIGLDYGMNLSESILAKLPSDLFTDAAGQVRFSITADASGEVTIFIENKTDPDNEFVIVAAARKPMTISHSPSVNEGATFTIEAKSDGVLITDATVIFTFDGQTWPTTTGIASIKAPSVVTSLTYPISASAEGYLTASSTIMVVNIPKLIIAIAGEVKTGQSFTLTIADDTGGPVIGATITFEGTTYTSGAGGTVTITAPSKAGSYPITASFPGYETISTTVTVEEGGFIPGFELLTLIAAIGVAFLLLRRRRK